MTRIFQVLLIIFLLTTFFNCSDKPPEVRISNQSRLSIDVFFKIVDCSCPSVSFTNVAPFSITSYKECSINKYEVRVKTIDVMDENTLTLQTEINKQYQINVDSLLNCSIDIFDR
jgi:hypothetical protein